MKRIISQILLPILVLMLLLPFAAQPAAASGKIEYDVKSHYNRENFEQYTLTTITKDDKPALLVKIDVSQAGLYLNKESISKDYVPKGEDYPEFHGFVNLIDSLPTEASDRDWKKDSVWGHDLYYYFQYNNAEQLVWDMIGYIHFPEFDLPSGPFFTIQFELSKLYPDQQNYYNEEAIQHRLSELYSILSKISVSFETPDDVIAQPGGAEQSITTQAGDDASASSEISTAVVVAITAAAAAIAGAGAAGAAAGAGTSAGANQAGDGESSDEEEKPIVRLRMVVSKNFGQYIRYGDEHVFVYARIVELSGEDGQKYRPDLTARINITTQSACLDLGPAQMAGDSMGAAVRAPGHQDSKPAEATITFSLAVGEGSFTNNVVFQMMDWAEIKMEGSSTLLESINELPDSCETPYELFNFLDFEGATVALEMKDKNLPFTVELVPESPNKGKIAAANDGSRQNTSEMFSYYFGKVRAKSSRDEAEKDFMVCTCRDGLYIDFGEGEKPEIKCYKKMNSDEMETTHALVGLAIFDRQERRLTVIAPDEIEVKIDDEKNIGKKIGIETEHIPRPVRGRFADNQLFSDFRIKAVKPLPYNRDIEAGLEVFCRHEEEEYFIRQPVMLRPDIFWYYDEFDKQHESLRKMVRDNFSPDVSKHYVHQLDIIRSRMGLADLQSYERHIRSAMQDVLEQSSEAAFATAENWDTAVTVLEWTAWVGDICSDLLIASFTGPLGAILADGGKDLIIEVARHILNSPDFSCEQIIEITWNSLTGSLTKNVDGFFEFPKPPAYAKIAIWLTVFVVYRIYWHWENDKDTVTGKPLGLENACKMAVRDVMLESVLRAGLDRMMRGKVQLSKGADGKHIYSETTRKTLHNLQSQDEKLIKNIKSGNLKELDKTATDVMKYAVKTTDEIANQAMHSIYSFMKYVGDNVDAAMIASFKAVGIIK